MGIILATATACTALLALLVPWTSVHALNRRGDAHRALELLRGCREVVDLGVTAGASNSTGMTTGAEEGRTRARGEERAENPVWATAATVYSGSYAPRVYSSEHGGRSKAETIAKACGNCGSPLAADDIFCGNCGQAVA